MRSLFVSCHMCGSFDSELITPAFLQNGDACTFQQIVICKRCGLVYKNPVVPELNTLVYKTPSWGDGRAFQHRIGQLASYLADALRDENPSRIVEIGPGPGWLAIAMEQQYPAAHLLLLEVSEEVAAAAKRNTRRAVVVPSSIDEVSLTAGYADLALVCGVDYLFPSHRASMERIYDALADGGHLYIERNVFVETEAYVLQPIRSRRDLFGLNALMTTWFSVEQYRAHLERWFDVVSTRSFEHGVYDGHRCVIHGFLCRKRPARGLYVPGTSWYEQNKASLGRLVEEERVVPGSNLRSLVGKASRRVRDFVSGR